MKKGFKYEIGDKVVSFDGCFGVVETRGYHNGDIQYGVSFGNGIDFGYYKESWLKPYDSLKNKETEEVIEDKGEVSDGYHTFNELYEYRLLYNASMFNELAKHGMYDVHKSKRHSDGNYPFDNPDYFIVVAELPTGQISNHYRMKEWDLFDIPEKEKSNEYDGHTPKDVAERLRSFLTPKPKYPKTYEECCEIVGGIADYVWGGYKQDLFQTFHMLYICRDAYWKIAGKEMGLGKPWEPNWTNTDDYKFVIGVFENKIIKSYNRIAQYVLAFPTEEMRDTFYENFKKEIEMCKELL